MTRKINIFCNNCKIQVGILTEDFMNSGLDQITFACPECNGISFSQTREEIKKMFRMPEGTKIEFDNNGNFWQK